MEINKNAESFETNTDSNCLSQPTINEEMLKNVESNQNIQNINQTEQNKVEQIQTLNQTKLINVSIIRMFSCIAIVVYHMLKFWTKYAQVYFPLNFGVQIFLFISGFLYSQRQIKSVKKFYIKNAIKICVPTAIFLAIFGLIYLICALCGYHVAVFNIVAPAGELVRSLGHLWFIYAILICYFLTPFLSKFISLKQIKNKTKSQKIQYILLICLIIFAILLEIYSISFSRTRSVLIPFLAGYFFKTCYEKLTKSNLKFLVMACCLIVFFGFGMLYYFAPSFEQILEIGGGAFIETSVNNDAGFVFHNIFSSFVKQTKFSTKISKNIKLFR